MADVYAGLFDDIVYKYPGAYEQSICCQNYHKDNLINSLLLGDTLYVNDGYLLQNAYLIKWLEQQNEAPSLFYLMCKSGYIRILSRKPEKPLSQLPENAPSVDSLRNVFKSPKFNYDVTKVTDALDDIDSLNANLNNNIRVRWPDRDDYEISEGFSGLMEKLLEPACKTNSKCQGDLREVFDDFRKKYRRNGTGARTVWEECAKRYVVRSGRTLQDLNDLMSIANVCYHLNFTAALTAFDKINFGNLRVQTIRDPWGSSDANFISLQQKNNCVLGNNVQETNEESSLCWTLKYPKALHDDELTGDKLLFVCDFLENEDLKLLRQKVSACIEILMKNPSAGSLLMLRSSIQKYNSEFDGFVMKFGQSHMRDWLGDTAKKHIVSHNPKLVNLFGKYGKIFQIVLSNIPLAEMMLRKTLDICSIASLLIYQSDVREISELEQYKTTYLQRPVGDIFSSHVKDFEKREYHS